MTFEGVLESVVRRVVREELERRPAAEPEPDLVSIGHVRRFVDVSPSWLKARIAEGALEKHKRGRKAMVKLDEVRALFARRATPVAAPAPSAQVARILASVRGGRR